jgi:hypothetical protein
MQRLLLHQYQLYHNYLISIIDRCFARRAYCKFKGVSGLSLSIAGSALGILGTLLGIPLSQLGIKEAYRRGD